MIPAGLHLDLPEDDYYSDSALSCSMAKVLARPGGPAKLQQRIAQPVIKAEFDLGHAAHEMVLGRGAAWVEVPGEWRTADTKARVADYRQRGITPLHSKDVETIHGMVAALQQHDEAMELLTEPGVHPEVTLVGEDPDTGLRIRSRVDMFGPAGTVDYKTSVSADPDKFRRDVYDFGYDMQDAWYSDLRAQVCDEEPLPFWFIVQEKVAPWLVSVIPLSETYRQIGRARNRAAIDLYVECAATGMWPGYLPVPPLEPPVWVARQHGLTLTDLDPDISTAPSPIWEGLNPWKDIA